MNSVEIGQLNQGNHHQQLQQQQVVTPTMDETAQNGADNAGGKPAGCKEDVFENITTVHNSIKSNSKRLTMFNYTLGGRRSNVVKQVEKLKKNREERRAKQQEIMEEKVAQKNVDPGSRILFL